MPSPTFVFIKIVSAKVQDWRACSERSLSVPWPPSCFHDHYIGASKFSCRIGSLSDASDESFVILQGRECAVLAHQYIRHSIGCRILQIADQSLRYSVSDNKVDVHAHIPVRLGNDGGVVQAMHGIGMARPQLLSIPYDVSSSPQSRPLSNTPPGLHTK
jgi:hypothetical protein